MATLPVSSVPRRLTCTSREVYADHAFRRVPALDDLRAYLAMLNATRAVVQQALKEGN
jgi:hypothetical protein